MVGGIKTKAGKNRLVLIHEKIKGFVSDAMKDITEKVYTDRDVEFLRRELSKV
jgi:hypothetical protein